MRALALAVLLAASSASAAVSYVGAGTACAITANSPACVPGLPAGIAAGDVLILVAHSRATTTALAASASPGTWATVATQTTNATGGRFAVWWLRYTTGATGPTVSGSATESRIARVYAFRGVISSGNPWQVVGTQTQQAAATTWSDGALTTTEANGMAVYVGGSMAASTWSTPTGSVDTVVTAANTQGTDNSTFLAYDATPTGTTVGLQSAPSVVQSISSAGTRLHFFLAEEPPAPTVTIDAGFPTVSPASCASAPTSASRTFTTPGANRLVLAVVHMDMSAGTDPAYVLSGGATSWTHVVTATHPTNGVEVGIWASWEASALTGVTATATTSLGILHCIALAVYSLDGTDSGGVGASNAATGTGNGPSVSLTPLSTDSLALAGGLLWATGAASPGRGQAELYDAAGASSAFGNRRVGGTSAGTPVTLDSTMAASDAWAIAAVEIEPIGGTPPPTTETCGGLMGFWGECATP